MAGWFDKLIEKGKEKAEKADSDMMKQGSLAALKALEANKENIIKVGEDWITKLVSNIASGHISAARELYIEKVATSDELIDDMAGLAEDIEDGSEKFEEAAARMDAILKGITSEVAKILLPLLIGLA